MAETALHRARPRLCPGVVVLAVACAAPASAPPANAVVGGAPAKRADFPFFTVVGSGDSGGSGCGGSLVTPRRVLTAAHCLEVASANMVVSAGPQNVRRKIVRIAIHPAHLRERSRQQSDVPPPIADVMVLDLSQPVRGVPPAPLATDNADAAGNTAITIGRGATNPRGDGTGATPFKAGVVGILADADCTSLQTAAERRWSLCARDPRAADPRARPPFTSACTGDSGGPLLVGGAIVGTVSWGPACGAKRDAEVYASTIATRDFILARQPVWRPELAGVPRLRGNLKAGAVVRCSYRWRVRPKREEVTFAVDGRVVQNGRRTRFRLRRRDAGKLVFCTVGGHGPGGGTGGTSPTLRVAP